MKKLIKRLLCKHRAKVPDNLYKYEKGRTQIIFRTKCVHCGKVWRTL